MRDPTLAEFITAEVGGRWFVGSRLTPKARANGYEHAIPNARYVTLQRKHARLYPHTSWAAQYVERHLTRVWPSLSEGERLRLVHLALGD